MLLCKYNLVYAFRSIHRVTCLHDTFEAVPQARDINKAERLAEIPLHRLIFLDLVTKFPQHFYRLGVLSLTQPTASKHWSKQYFLPVRTANKHDNYCLVDRLTVSSYVCVYVDVVEGREAHSSAEICRLRTTTCGRIIMPGLSTLFFQTNVTFFIFWNNSVLRHRCP